MTVVRSILYNLLFWAFGTVMSCMMVFLLPFPHKVMQAALGFWARTVIGMLGWVVGLKVAVRGLENLPKGAVILASKHQSAWDTGAFYLFCRDPAYILKKELLRVPLFGWFLARAGMIGIDRRRGAKALRTSLRESQVALAQGRQVIIFPEGTRTAPGTRLPYHPGIFALYDKADAPVVPVALNSGLFWGRRQFLKRPGVITLEILPALPKGLDRKAFMAELERRIETASERLVAEARAKEGARARSPVLPG